MSTSSDVGLGAGRFVASSGRPPDTQTTVHTLDVEDGATVHGVLTTHTNATSVVTLMHPRRDLTHHAMVPHLLDLGVAVWTQHPRSVNNDLNLLHEQSLLDVAAGMAFLRDAGFESITTFGHSGGGPLYAFYIEQASLDPEARLRTAPSGRPIPLRDATMPVPEAAIFLAPHPGQGKLLLHCIDPSVADEADPLSVRSDLDMFDPSNGFAPPPQSSTYSDDFLQTYRAAQKDRVARIDAVARRHLEQTAAARTRHKETGSPVDRREVIAPRFLTVYRTDADPRYVDLSLDPNDRPYGSVLGRRPDLSNYGRIGFGRLSTPEAWLSTWSGLSSRADFERCAAGVTVPTLFLELTGDQACFPTQSRGLFDALGSDDKAHKTIRATHFGGALDEDDPTGIEVAAAEISSWLNERDLSS